MARDQILLVHLGGLGDVCLSESTFLSLVRHFGQKLIGIGYTRFLSLFPDYFSSIHSVDGRGWAYLFSDHLEGPEWQKIVFIGKDRSGTLRDRLATLSNDGFLFVDMWPDLADLHVEDYQLGQLDAMGIAPVRRPARSRSGHGLILYPEKGYSKQKWPYENFLEVYNRLRKGEPSVSLLEPFDTVSPHPESFRFDELSNLTLFLAQANFFVSNDCGIAHLAASSGLTTITLFHDADPAVWHPVGNNHSIRCSSAFPSVMQLLTVIGTVGRDLGVGAVVAAGRGKG